MQIVKWLSNVTCRRDEESRPKKETNVTIHVSVRTTHSARPPPTFSCGVRSQLQRIMLCFS